jgi:trimethylamine--corrinoid protein Co-methyltransferase
MTQSENRVQPAIHVLTNEQVEAIHSYSVKILETVGIRVDSEDAIRLFEKKTSRRFPSQQVTIPRDVISWALDCAPGQVRLFDREGRPAFTLDAHAQNQTRFGIGVTNTHYQQVDTDAVVPFLREHTRISALLGDHLDAFDVISTIGIPQDLAPPLVDLYNAIDLYAHTRKPIILLLVNGQRPESVYEVLEHMHGDLSSQPGVLSYVNPITPLILNQDTCKKIEASIRFGCPVIYSNYGMYGASTPMSMAGTLALMNAELLAGLVYCQLLKEGAPVILGSLPASFDMNTMGSAYSPGSLLLNLACAELMAYYGIPHCGTSGSGIGWGPDLPASDHLWMNHLSSCLGKVGLAPFVGGNFDSLVFSPTTVVYSNQIIKQVREFVAGFKIDDDAVALEEIFHTGPGGSFLTSEQTLNGLAKESRNLWSGMSLDKWIEEGQPSATSRLKDHVKHIMQELHCSDACKALVKQGESLIDKLQ